MSKTEESGRVPNINANGISIIDSTGYNGGFTGEPAGSYNLPSIEAQYPRQQYTNTNNIPFTSREDSVGPIGNYSGGFNQKPVGWVSAGTEIPTENHRRDYPERGQYF